MTAKSGVAVTQSTMETRPAATVTSLKVNANAVSAKDKHHLPTHFQNGQQIRYLIENNSATFTNVAVNANAVKANGKN